MTENKDIKETTQDVQNDKPLKPFVNGKLKFYLIIAVILLCIITALAVAFSPEAKEKRKEVNEKIVQALF